MRVPADERTVTAVVAYELRASVKLLAACQALQVATRSARAIESVYRMKPRRGLSTQRDGAKRTSPRARGSVGEMISPAKATRSEPPEGRATGQPAGAGTR